jgi:hypothetical protein
MQVHAAVAASAHDALYASQQRSVLRCYTSAAWRTEAQTRAFYRIGAQASNIDPCDDKKSMFTWGDQQSFDLRSLDANGATGHALGTYLQVNARSGVKRRGLGE